MDSALRVGIIGCGVIAPSHIDSYCGIEGVSVEALCDKRPDRLEDIQRRYPQAVFRCYPDVAGLLAHGQIDAVSICTPHDDHEATLLQVLAAGKHVICEKPLSIGTDSLDRMVGAAQASPLVCAGIFQHRFDAVYRELRKVLAEGLIGRLLTARAWHHCYRPAAYYEADAWRGKWSTEGGSLLINQSIHFIDILQWLGGGVDSVSASLANHCHDGVIETEDCASLQLTFSNGALGSFTATSSSHLNWSYGFHFAGSDGDVEIREGRLYHCSHRDAGVEEQINKRLGAVRDGDGVSAAKDYYGSGHPAQLSDFVRAIREGRAPEVSIADAAVANRIVLAAYGAAQQGRRITF